VKPAFCKIGPSAARIALPSASFGQRTPTFLFVFTGPFHCEMYAPAKSATPKLKWCVHLNGFLPPGLAPRPKYQASHGCTVDTCGTPAASHASAIGLFVSGVDVDSIRSTLLLLMSDFASWPARAGSDCVSLATIVTE
jgi:hypothetical protein